MKLNLLCNYTGEESQHAIDKIEDMKTKYGKCAFGKDSVKGRKLWGTPNTVLYTIRVRDCIYKKELL